MKKRLFLSILLLIGFITAGAQTQDFYIKPSPGLKKDVKITFRVKWDAKVIPDVTHVSGLKRKTEVLEHRGGGDPSLLRHSPGVNKYEPIVIKRPRGLGTEFEQWANKVWNYGSGLGSEVSLRDFRKDVLIEVCNANGKVLLAFKVYRCWPSEYIALSDLDAEEDALAMEVLVLEHEGWERDYTIR